MNFLKSRWTPFILCIVINLGLTAYLINSQREMLFTGLPMVNIELPPLLWSFKDAEVEKMISELRSERKRLDSREADLEKTAAQIAVEREELAKVRAEIQSARDQLSTSIVELQEAEVKNLKTLSTTYSSVAPAAAVNIFAQMEETMVVKILSLMKADKVAAIFQEMAKARTPDDDMTKRAARISDKLRLLKANKDPKP